MNEPLVLEITLHVAVGRYLVDGHDDGSSKSYWEDGTRCIDNLLDDITARLGINSDSETRRSLTGLYVGCSCAMGNIRVLNEAPERDVLDLRSTWPDTDDED